MLYVCKTWKGSAILRHRILHREWVWRICALMKTSFWFLYGLFHKGNGQNVFHVQIRYINIREN